MIAQTLKLRGNDMDRHDNDVTTLHLRINVQAPKLLHKNTYKIIRNDN